MTDWQADMFRQCAVFKLNLPGLQSAQEQAEQSELTPHNGLRHFQHLYMPPWPMSFSGLKPMTSAIMYDDYITIIIITIYCYYNLYNNNNNNNYLLLYKIV